VSSTIEWAAVESLLLAAVARLIEGRGSRVRFEKDGEVATFHRPRLAKEAIPGARCPRLPGTDWGETMTNTMTYKGYAARIEYDDQDGIFTGRIAGIRDGVGFHADTVEGLRDAFHEAVEDYIETCAKIGKEPQKTYSGQVMFRVSPEVHRKAALAAELSGKSLNQWAEEVLDRAAG
jgi:predicted HicB family RNase H-like nuclease